MKQLKINKSLGEHTYRFLDFKKKTFLIKLSFMVNHSLAGHYYFPLKPCRERGKSGNDPLYV